MSAGLELLEFNTHKSKGKLLGHASFRLVTNGLIIRKCSVLESEHGIYVKLPEHMEGEDDAKRWLPTIDFIDEARRDQFGRHAARLVGMHLRGERE